MRKLSLTKLGVVVSALAGLAAALGGAVGCKEDKPGGAPQGTPPPPPPNMAATGSGAASAGAAKNLCDPSAVGIVDAKTAVLLPATIEGYCVLKTDGVRAWGEGTGKKIEDVSDIIDGMGELYSHNYFAKRYDSLKYVEGAGTGAEVEVTFTTYDKPENAYALFTYKNVSNQDPDPEAAKKQNRTPLRKLEGGGAASLGNANALLWKGNYLVELTYVPDATKSLTDATKAADAILPKFVKAIADKLVGAVDPPADVRLLPTEAEGRLPLGIDYVPAKYKKPEGKGDALHVSAGAYAQAFMRDGKKRFRVLAFSRDEKDAARDAIAAFSKLPGAVPLKEAKDFSDEAWHFPFTVGQGGAGAGGKAEGVAARRGSMVYAVIDEELALGDPANTADWPRLTKDEKVTKLKAIMSKAGTAPVAPSSSAAPSAAPSASASK